MGGRTDETYYGDTEGSDIIDRVAPKLPEVIVDPDDGLGNGNGNGNDGNDAADQADALTQSVVDFAANNPNASNLELARYVRDTGADIGLVADAFGIDRATGQKM